MYLHEIKKHNRAIALFRKILSKVDREKISAVEMDGDSRFVLKIKDLVTGYLRTKKLLDRIANFVSSRWLLYAILGEPYSMSIE